MFAPLQEKTNQSYLFPKKHQAIRSTYALWSEVNRRMRKQELKWPGSKRETRKAYLARLRRTAMRLPTDFINKSIEDMRTRCSRLRAAQGQHFREGA